jgi:hypothetical protein
MRLHKTRACELWPFSLGILRNQPIRVVYRRGLGMHGSQNELRSSDTLLRALVNQSAPEKMPLEHRVLLACKTLRALPDREGRFLGNAPLQQSFWRKALTEWDSMPRVLKPKFIPTRKEIDYCWKVLAWVAPIEKNSSTSCGFACLVLAFRESLNSHSGAATEFQMKHAAYDFGGQLSF